MKDNDSGFVPLSEVLGVWREASVPASPSADFPPPLTGYRDLDRMVGPLDEGDLLVLGSGTGVGKSSLALNICANLAKGGYTCGIVSPTMDRQKVAIRMMVAESGITFDRLRLGLLSEGDQRAVADAVALLAEMPISIDDTRNQSVDEVQSKVQRLKSARRLDFLLVDDFTVLHGAGTSRTQQIGDVARTLKGIARELEITIMACSQLGRPVENIAGNRPQLHHLQGSGEIEESADVVVLLYREDMVFSEDEWKHHAPGRPYPRNIGELIVAKNRRGQTGNAYVYFRENITRFDELAHYETSAA